jgi:threonyl-tRNA synthetase
VVIPVTEKHQDYGREVAAALKAKGVRVTVDDRNEKLGYKIREAQKQKIPYMLVVGAREQEAGAAAVRLRSGEDLGALPIAAIAERIQDRERTRTLEP